MQLLKVSICIQFDMDELLLKLKKCVSYIWVIVYIMHFSFFFLNIACIKCNFVSFSLFYIRISFYITDKIIKEFEVLERQCKKLDSGWGVVV